MERQIIARGLLAGAIAGVPAFLFARTFLEPVISQAIAYEDGRGELHLHGAGHDHGVELFTRGVQANIGMGFGVLAFSVAMAALFAVIFCVAYGRIGELSAHLLSLLLAGGMFLSLYVIPFLKYPPSPPAVGLEESIRQRTLLYLLLVVLSAVLLVAAVSVARQLTPRFGGWSATLMAGAGYVLAIATVMVVLPDIDETPGPVRDEAGNLVYPGFPADTLYDFRLYSLATQVLMWAAIGVVFASLVRPLLGERERHLSASRSA
jgi:predicted cobalt transporter CbtA